MTQNSLNKTIFSVYLENPLIEVIQELAKKNCRNRNLQVEFMLKTYLKEHEEDLLKSLGSEPQKELESEKVKV